MPRISQVRARKILNSKGNWTINTEVRLEDGARGHGEIPEGGSKGGFEAVSVDPDYAVSLVNEKLTSHLCGQEASDQRAFDKMLLALDGTPDKSRLGENTILSLSIAVAKAVSHSRNIPLFRYLAEVFETREIGLPTPVFNVINGGKHAQNDLSLQEFMIIPAKKQNYNEALTTGVKVFHCLRHILMDKGLDVEAGDEGGFAPDGLNTRGALDLLSLAVKKCAFELDDDVFLGIDAAANSFYANGKYRVEAQAFKSAQLKQFYVKLINDYPIIYLEDPFNEEDRSAWSDFGATFKNSLLVVGDDLTVTNVKRLEKAASLGACNAVVVKPNQIGTLTETYDFVKSARKLGFTIVVSHRSGEAVVDTFIADFAVAVNADYIKAGAPAHERVAKYNKLLEIYDELNGIEGACSIG